MLPDWADYEALAQHAAEYMNTRHLHLEAAFGLGHHDRYDVDLYSGTIAFSSGGVLKVSASCRPAGSLSHISDTWLWAWANMNLPPEIRGLSKRARLLGRKLDHPRLVEPKWPANEDDAWEGTAILVYLTEADGAYRCPQEKGDYFVVLSGVCSVGG